MKVYLLTTGDYEDERVVGVFTSMEKLNEFKTKFHSCEGYNDEIEIFEIDYFPDVVENEKIYSVNKDVNERMYAYGSDISDLKYIGELFIGEFGHRSTYVWASSEEEAIEKGRKILENKE